MSDMSILEIQLTGSPDRSFPDDCSWHYAWGGLSVLLGGLEGQHIPQSRTRTAVFSLVNPGNVPPPPRVASSNSVPVVHARQESEARWTSS